MPTMGTKSREVIWGGRIGAAKINAESARQSVDVMPLTEAAPANDDNSLLRI
jgi:hypothetical protein